ncbi:MAG: phenylalanine--tRNA ligase beta subunit-related protein [Acidobacteria bacterium]|nr:phenylalanine--tRNA ligase beta subunit-related protein [Acidobacteriota bacterium]
MGEILIETEGVKIGAIFLNDALVIPTDNSLREMFDNKIEELLKSGRSEEIKRVVRNMLRYGKYKPSGRGKPASEYLWESAQEGRFPFINNFVDCLNFVSLKSGLPISLIDIEKANTENFKIRRGKSGESYIFNSAGQILNLEDLLLTASLESDEPFATPVKDSQKTKIDGNSKKITAIIYSPKEMQDFLFDAVKELTELFSNFGNLKEQKIV